ncbi:MAG: hypothetical protein JWM91_3029 [Rhodospirillales bacterium]|nr:hypothetical protein [Rhodospirillales bacterium]
MTDRLQFLIGGGALALGGAAATYAGFRQMGSMDAYNDTVAESRAALSQHPEMRDLIRYATLAPSGHNTQLWQFEASPDRIAILPDFSRRTPVVDPDDHHLFVGLGAAAENLSVAATARGRPAEIAFASAGAGSVTFAFGSGKPAESALFDAIADASRPVPTMTGGESALLISDCLPLPQLCLVSI